MKNTKILPIVAALGLILAGVVALRSSTAKPVSVPITLPAQAPFAAYLGGSGMVEASNQNLSIGTSLPGIVKLVAVNVGARVKEGQILFQIDDRELRADLLLKEANLLKSESAVLEAQASQADAGNQYALVAHSLNSKAVSLDDVQKRKDALGLANARIVSAQASVKASRAEVMATRTALERLVVRAPMAGEVLQVNVRAGEYAPTGVLTTPLLRLGSLDQLNVRVDIDENDAWRFTPGTRAKAFLRGNRDLNSFVTFVRVEPYITPKVSLTGSSSERVDTRVLQVIYSFDRRTLPAYVGQQMDVFIETPPVKSDATPAGGHS